MRRNKKNPEATREITYQIGESEPTTMNVPKSFGRRRIKRILGDVVGFKIIKNRYRPGKTNPEKMGKTK